MYTERNSRSVPTVCPNKKSIAWGTVVQYSNERWSARTRGFQDSLCMYPPGRKRKEISTGVESERKGGERNEEKNGRTRREYL